MFDKKLMIDNIRYLAKKQGMSLGKLQGNIGVSVGYFSRLEKSNSMPNLEVVMRTADVLDVSMDELLYSDVRPPTALLGLEIPVADVDACERIGKKVGDSVQSTLLKAITKGIKVMEEEQNEQTCD